MKRLEPAKNALADSAMLECLSFFGKCFRFDPCRLLAVRFFLLIDGVVQPFEELALFLRV